MNQPVKALTRVKGLVSEVELRSHKKYDYLYREDTSDKAMMKDCRDHYSGIYQDPRLVGATVLDLGANIGYFSHLCLEYFAKRVICVEADEANCSVIEANMGGEFDKAIIICGAVVPDSHEGDTVTFYTGNSDQSLCSGSTLAGRARGNSFTTNAHKISDLLRLHRPIIVKCDIEGGEFDLFKDLEIPDYVKIVALEVHESAEWMKPRVKELIEKFSSWNMSYRNENIVFGALYATDIVFARE